MNRARNRVMTGVGFEPTTYGLKERGAATTRDDAPSDSGALRRAVTTPQNGETRPKEGAVCEKMCMASDDRRTSADADDIDWLPGSVGVR